MGETEWLLFPLDSGLFSIPTKSPCLLWKALEKFDRKGFSVTCVKTLPGKYTFAVNVDLQLMFLVTFAGGIFSRYLRPSQGTNCLLASSK